MNVSQCQDGNVKLLQYCNGVANLLQYCSSYSYVAKSKKGWRRWGDGAVNVAYDFISAAVGRGGLEGGGGQGEA